MRHLLAITSQTLPLNEPNLWNHGKPISLSDQRSKFYANTKKNNVQNGERKYLIN